MSENGTKQKELQDRLDLGIAEAHHRVKNTLQNIISYITLMFARKESVQKDDIEKLIRFIRSLASLHDFLRESDHRKTSAGLIRVDMLLNDIVSLHATDYQVSCEELPPSLCAPRQAATLSLIMTELLANASRYGSGEITLHKMPSEDTFLTIAIENKLTQPLGDVRAPSNTQGAHLVKSLARADFGFEPEYIISDSSFKVVLKIPITPFS